MSTQTPGIIPDAKLLPCPFCGKKGAWFKTGRDVGIECGNKSNCPGSAQTAVYEPEHAEHAVGRWNTRNDQAAEHYADVLASREELLKALQDLVKVCELALDDGGRTSEYFRARDGHLVKSCDAMKSSNAAIANATGNPT